SIPRSILNLAGQQMNTSSSNNIENSNENNCLPGPSSAYHNPQIHFEVTRYEGYKTHGRFNPYINQIIARVNKVDKNSAGQCYSFQPTEGNSPYILNKIHPQTSRSLNLQTTGSPSLNFLDRQNVAYCSDIKNIYSTFNSSNSLISWPLFSDSANNYNGEINLQIGTFASTRYISPPKLFNQGGFYNQNFAISNGCFEAQVIPNIPSNPSIENEVIAKEEPNIEERQSIGEGKKTKEL
ncbi:MAG: hypothetical protein ACRCU2_03725, partial [Planktothrix sp.]